MFSLPWLLHESLRVNCMFNQELKRRNGMIWCWVCVFGGLQYLNWDPMLAGKAQIIFPYGFYSRFLHRFVLRFLLVWRLKLYVLLFGLQIMSLAEKSSSKVVRFGSEIWVWKTSLAFSFFPIESETEANCISFCFLPSRVFHVLRYLNSQWLFHTQFFSVWMGEDGLACLSLKCLNRVWVFTGKCISVLLNQKLTAFSCCFLPFRFQALLVLLDNNSSMLFLSWFAWMCSIWIKDWHEQGCNRKPRVSSFLLLHFIFIICCFLFFP